MLTSFPVLVVGVKMINFLEMKNPLVIRYIDVEAMAQSKGREFSHQQHGDFPYLYMSVYQRVTILNHSSIIP